jgi:hypothetical protein
MAVSLFEWCWDNKIRVLQAGSMTALLSQRYPHRVPAEKAAQLRIHDFRRQFSLEWCIQAEKKIADGPAAQVGQPPLRDVMRSIMDHVAALAEALEIGRIAVRRVMVEMRCREDDARDAHPIEVGAPRRWALVAMPVAPAGLVMIEPAAVH